MAKQRLPEIPKKLSDESSMRRYMEEVADAVNHVEPAVGLLTDPGATLGQTVTKVNEIIQMLRNARITKTP